jgi:DNA ligase-4
MPFRFAHVCDLLDKLDHVYSRYPPYLPKDATQKSRDAVLYWFRKHGQKIRHDANGLALLSTLFPERTHRVHGLDSKSLEKIISRSLSLPSSRITDLTRWREPGARDRDLGACVERVVNQEADVSFLYLGFPNKKPQLQSPLLTMTPRKQLHSHERA